LLGEDRVKTSVRELFLKKCKSKGVEFSGTGQFFPDGIEDALKKHLPRLTRLANEPIEIGEMLSETRRMIPGVL